VYIIEFQKRGLPQCYILLWLEVEDKITTPSQVDQYISAKIPDKEEDPELYQIVTDHMMHGPCGPKNLSCLCMVGFKCTKKFPKQFNESTFIDESGYVIYRRRNNGNTIKKSRSDLHNGYVVPYNPSLLRYLSACESAWWIYGFDIHYRTPSVESQDSEVRGPTKWDDLKEFNDVIDPTYRDACYARGLLEDDKEYIDGLLEASLWGTGDYLRSFFVMLLMADSMSRQEVVWEKTWHVMAADVLNVERKKRNEPGSLEDIPSSNTTKIENLYAKENNIQRKDKVQALKCKCAPHLPIVRRTFPSDYE
ncbi:hypothetical protein Tco_0944559, partial [Tanacetum coccineum]